MTTHRRIIPTLILILLLLSSLLAPINSAIAQVDDGNTVALLHMDGEDASISFVDETGKTWTANGNAQIDTAQSKFGGASGLFDGSGDFLSASDSDDWQLDGGSNSNEWTIDFWVWFNGDPGTGVMGFVTQHVDNNNKWYVALNNNRLNFGIVSGGTTVVNILNNWNPAGNTWYHIAYVKQGTTGYKMFVDGSQIGSTQTDADVMPNFSGGLRIGRLTQIDGVNRYLNGWLDEVRISKGIARWTSDFTPPEAPYAPPPSSTDTPTNTITNTPLPTDTPTPTDTDTPIPTDTDTPMPTDTDTPMPTDTDTPMPTDTRTQTPSVTPGGPTLTPSLPEWYIDNTITYGDYMLNVVLLALCGVVIVAMVVIVILLIVRRRKAGR